ncbi:hypothetical protein [Haloterrigena salinisoli]|uniref:hypothetical protein n=1 Tax=Haloterrigena salinisoli TaxID=3132747 RepID=UPI0030D12840
MTDERRDVDPAALEAELAEIKGAIGLAEDHPYWWRFWLVEGVGAGLCFTLIQFWFRGGPRLWILAAVAGLLGLETLVKRRIKAAYEPPTRGLHDTRLWLLAALAGIGAVIVGLLPVFDALGDRNAIRLALVSAGAIVGSGYIYMGQLLGAYDIRAIDRYAFYAGGAWILVLAAVIPHVPAAEGWEYAVLARR